MEITSESWAIIINPKSGKRKFREQLHYLFLQLKRANILFDHRVTQFAGHATAIAKRQAEKGYTNFVIVGGDGTISETINGLMSSNIDDKSAFSIAIIPKGTGNDWARFWGLSRNYQHSIGVFLQHKKRLIDIGRVDFTYKDKQKTHYFINSVGFGLDAAVVNITQRMKRYIGSHSFLYTIALLKAVFTYRAENVRVETAETTISDKMFTMNVANGCYSGGGMKQNPNAIPYDGLLDTILAKKPTFLDIISALRRLFNGKLLEHPIIESFQAKDITLDCGTNILMEADGIIVNGTSPFRICIIANAIQMVVS